MKEQLLTEIKEDLKGCENGFGPKSFGSHIFSCGGENGLCPTCKERIKTKLQAYHRMASDEKKYLKIFLSGDFTKEDTRELDFLSEEYIKLRIEELSTFIEEIEIIAKEQGVELE